MCEGGVDGYLLLSEKINNQSISISILDLFFFFFFTPAGLRVGMRRRGVGARRGAAGLWGRWEVLWVLLSDVRC